MPVCRDKSIKYNKFRPIAIISIYLADRCNNFFPVTNEPAKDWTLFDGYIRAFASNDLVKLFHNEKSFISYQRNLI